MRHQLQTTAGLRAARNLPLAFEQLEERAMLAGNGLTGQYFHNENFTGLAVERIEAVNFNWGSASPAPGLDADTYSVRWTGQIQAQYSQSYTFFVTSNQGMRMWIDGQLLIDNWTPHNTETNSASIDLVAG